MHKNEKKKCHKTALIYTFKCILNTVLLQSSLEYYTTHKTLSIKYIICMF